MDGRKQPRESNKALKKQALKPSALLNPVPVVMCSCCAGGEKDIVTAAWCGTVNSEPPMLSVSLRKSRYSHKLISESGKVCINLVSTALVRAADWCGVRSGREVDKFAELGLTAVDSPVLNVPMIGEAPVNIECRVDRVLELGSHDMFLLNVEGVYAAEYMFDEKGALDLKKAKLAAYSHGEYYELGRILGFFGYSVASPEALAKRKRT